MEPAIARSIGQLRSNSQATEASRVDDVDDSTGNMACSGMTGNKATWRASPAAAAGLTGIITRLIDHVSFVPCPLSLVRCRRQPGSTPGNGVLTKDE